MDFKPPQYLKITSLLLLLFINSLFIVKYGLRIFPITYVIVGVVFYILTMCIFIKFIFSKIVRINIPIQLITILLCLICLIALQLSIDPYSIKVDRWSAIHNFHEKFFKGEYPYAAQTHLGGYGSPFPAWQIFHIPFYLMGDVGLSFILSVLLFWDSIRRFRGYNQAFLSVLILFISPCCIYEVGVRSDLLSNFLVCSAVLVYFQTYNINLRDHLFFVCLIMGLMGSTRISTIIPFAIYFFPDLLNLKLPKILLGILITSLVFIVTFIPFFLWDGDMLLFFEYNPFILQTRQGNIADFLIFIPLGLYLALSWHNNFFHYLFNVSIMLFLFVTITFCHNMYRSDTWSSIFLPLYDITYFDMCIPFLCFLIVEIFSCSAHNYLSKKTNYSQIHQ